MDSIKNERDDPEPELVEDLPSPKMPPLCDAVTTSASHDTTGGSDQCVPPLLPGALTELAIDQSLVLSRKERKRKNAKEEKGISHDHIDIDGIADYSKAKVMLQELRDEKGYDLLQWNGL